MDIKKSKNREKKEELVAQIVEKKDKAKALLFANYQGLTHKQIEDLKKGIKSFNADFLVAKNTLLQKAMTDKKELETLEGPTATVFIYDDIVGPLKELAKSIKLLGLPTIKFGFLDGKMTSSEDLLRISTLPTKEVLLGQVVMGLKSPIFGLHRAMSWNLQKLVMTLKSIEEVKGKNG